MSQTIASMAKLSIQELLRSARIIEDRRRGGSKNYGTPCSNFPDYSGPFTEMILTGQLAMFAGAGKQVQWDVAAMKCTNRDELNKYLKRSYRKGWEV